MNKKIEKQTEKKTDNNLDTKVQKPKFKKKTGSADMNILAEWGCPIVAYGPGDSSLDHTSEEHILVSEYEKSISILINSLKRIY